MQKSNRVLLLSVLAVAFLVIAGYLIVSGRTDNAKSAGGQPVSGSLSVRNELLTNQLLLHSKYGALPLQTSIIVTDSMGVKQSLKKVIGIHRTIVYRISGLQCIECVKSQQAYLNKLSEALGKERLIVLASFDSFKAFKIFFETHDFGVKPYFIPFEEMSALPVELMNIPYFFEVNELGIPGHLFIPSKEMPELSDAWCNETINNH